MVYLSDRFTSRDISLKIKDKALDLRVFSISLFLFLSMMSQLTMKAVYVFSQFLHQ